MEIKIINKNNELTQDEINEYIRILEEKNGRRIEKIELELDGDYVNCTYTLSKYPFERIRRITGYLVGSLENWNDAKKSEESDRVKHNYTMEEI